MSQRWFSVQGSPFQVVSPALLQSLGNRRSPRDVVGTHVEWRVGSGAWLFARVLGQPGRGLLCGGFEGPLGFLYGFSLCFILIQEGLTVEEEDMVAHCV